LQRLVVGYCRVSTASTEQQQALPVQRSRIEREGCTLILSDVESGLETERPSYQELRRLVAAGMVEQVVATEFSRLGRDALEADAFVRLCDDHQTVVRTLSDGVLSLLTPDGMVMTRLKGSMAQAESMRLSIRVNRGLEEGRRLRKPMRQPCWGYRLRADRMAFEPDPDAWPSCERFITALEGNGWRLSTALQECRAWVPFRSCRGVRAWLLNPTLRGGIGYHQTKNHTYREIHWGCHQPLLTAGQFAEFERLQEQNRRIWGTNRSMIPRPLTSLCVCGECGCRMKYISGRTIPSLRCFGSLCSQLYKGTREDVIIRFCVDALTTRAAEKLAGAVNQDEPLEARELRRTIVKLRAMDDPDLAPVIKEKERRLELLLAQPVADDLLVQKIADPRWFELLFEDELREIFQALVEHVTVTKQAPTAIRLRL
jgi:DNA invertase Pin-like site-specific DNA recombinase